MRTVIIPDMSSSGAGRIIMIDKVFPSRARRYQHAFVYRRARGYVEAGYNVDMLCIRPRKIPCYREYDGIDVYEGYDAVLRKVLESMTYTETVFVHFLSPYIWNVLKHYLDRIRLVIFCHGSDILPYKFFAPILGPATDDRTEMFNRRKLMWDEVCGVSASADIRVVFVSEYLKTLSIKEFNINPDCLNVIHNFIDTDFFRYIPKDVSQRFRIVSIKSYDSRIYANDVTRDAIILLSRHKSFSLMTFDLYGDGQRFETDTRDLADFPNVTVHRRFLSPSEIAEVHKDHGIILCITRFDTQGVSRDEAMSSGLVPITNPVAAVPEFVDDSCAMLVAPDNPQAVADAILSLANDAELFSKLSAAAAQRVRALSSKRDTIEKELRLL